MNGQTRIICALLLHAICFTFTFGQSNVDELRKEQKQLADKIALANKLLSDNQSRQKDTELQMALLARKIDARKELMTSLSNELASIDRQKKESDREIEKLQGQKSNLTDSYGEVLQASYRSKLLKNRWLFLFSAQSLPQMYRRWQYLKQLNDGVLDRLNQITETAAGIDRELAKLQELQLNKKRALALEAQERKILDQDIDRRKKALSQLGQEATKLRNDIRTHQKAQEKLRVAILNSISDANNGEKDLPLTPAMVRLSSSFTSNKGKLPWPVGRGLVVRSFGKQVHPTLRNVTIVNNGVDITTDPGAPVKAVFEGTVVGQQFIPGYDHMVIVSHGNYYSVYSYLESTMVTKGEKINTGDNIGRARTTDGIGQVHLEIWKGKELLDPQSWLKDH